MSLSTSRSKIDFKIYPLPSVSLSITVTPEDKLSNISLTRTPPWHGHTETRVGIRACRSSERRSYLIILLSAQAAILRVRASHSKVNTTCSKSIANRRHWWTNCWTGSTAAETCWHMYISTSWEELKKNTSLDCTLSVWGQILWKCQAGCYILYLYSGWRVGTMKKYKSQWKK